LSNFDEEYNRIVNILPNSNDSHLSERIAILKSILKAKILWFDLIDGVQNTQRVEALIRYIDAISSLANSNEDSMSFKALKSLQNIHLTLNAFIKGDNPDDLNACHVALSEAEDLLYLQNPGASYDSSKLIDILQEAKNYLSNDNYSIYSINYQLDNNGKIVDGVVGEKLPNNSDGENPWHERLIDTINDLVESLGFLLGATDLGGSWAGVGHTLNTVGLAVGVYHDYKSGESPFQALVSQTAANVAGDIFSDAITNGIPTIVPGTPGILLGTIGGFFGGAYMGIKVDQAIDALFDAAQNLAPRVDPLVLDLRTCKKTTFTPARMVCSLLNAFSRGSVNFIYFRTLNKNGFEMIAASEGVVFDHDGDGQKTGTGWVGSNDGFLIFDRNNDGIINNGGELFGEHTLKYSGSGKYADAFEALAQEDTNGDGVVNAQDANWTSLKVWRDLNQDGISQENEFFTLDELGIAGFSTEKTAANGGFLAGRLTAQGTYTKTDGTTGKLGQFDLTENLFYREFEDSIDIPGELRDLPNMGGSGALRDLLQVAVGSTELQNILRQFSEASIRDQQLALVDQLLYAWANTSGYIESFQERCLERYDGIVQTVQNGVPEGDIAAWDRKVHILSAFNGQYFIKFPEGEDAFPWFIVSRIMPYTPPDSSSGSGSSGTNVPQNTIPQLTVSWDARHIELLNEAYNDLFSSVYEALALQTRLLPIVERIGLAFDIDNFTLGLDFSAIESYFSEALGNSFNSNFADLMDFTNAIKRFELSDGWLGHEMIHDAIMGQEHTAEILELLESFNINMYGLSSFTANGINDRHDLVIGGIGNDLLKGFSGNDSLYGETGDDTLLGGQGDDILHGGDGNDLLYGEDGDDTLHGEAGDDRLEGGAGDDVYIFNLGDGHDVINDYEYRAGKRNVIRFGEGISEDSLEFTLKTSASSNYMDLVILVKETGETITVERGVCNNTVNANNLYSIQAIEFADGTAWEWSDIAARPMHLSGTITNATVNALAEGGILIGNENGNVLQGASSVANVLYGGDGDDTLKGGSLGDVLYGGTGNDRLEGGAGDDVYVFNLGDGHDVISDYEGSSAKRNVIRFGEGISGDSLEFILKASASSSYMDLVILVKETGETVTVERGVCNATVNANNYYSIQALEFADGTVWEWSDIAARPMHLSGTITNATVNALAEGGILIGNENGNVLQGASSVANVLYGGDGDDTLKGGNLGDVLHGGTGDDLLQGGGGDDLLHGGTGNDRLEGGTGDDVYIFNLGDGHNVISDYEGRSAKRNVIRFGEGISGDSLEFTLKASATYGYMDLVILVKETGETVTVERGVCNNTVNANTPYSIQAIEFADGTTWEWSDIAAQPMHLSGTISNATVYGLAEGGILIGNEQGNVIYGASSMANALYGGGGGDTLKGGNLGDVLHGGADNDRLEGGAGDDVYLFNLGDGHDVISDYEGRSAKRNVIRFGEGISGDSLEFTLKANASGSYMDLVILIKETGETVTVERGICNNTVNANNPYSIQAIEFADGTVWEWADIAARPMHLFGMISNATVYALAEGGILIGNENDNTLQGSSVADRLLGGSGDETLKGNNGDDVLHGGLGTDRMEGGAGDDVYLFNLDDGHDVIYEYENRTGRNNVVKLGEGIAVDDIELLAKPTNGNYSDLIIRIKSSGETITVLNGMLYNTANSSNSYSIQAIEFADGTLWEWSDIAAQPMTVAEGSYNNYGYAASEGGNLHGNAADNKMLGSANADALYGGAGDDTLLGYAGDDLLHGGAAADRLEGGAGDDVYLFNLGDGHDVIYEYENRTGKNNVVRLGEGITAANIELLAKPTNGNYSDLIIRLKSTGETITILNGMQYNVANSSNYYSIQAIEFADGTVWEWSDIAAQPMTVMEGSYSNYGYAASEGGILHGNSADNQMWGSTNADALFGGAGDDTLLRYAGADVLHGGAGADRLEGGAGDDAYRYNLGDGQDTIYDTAGNDSLILGDDIDMTDLWFTRSGNNLIINVADQDNSVTVQNWYSGASYKVESIQSGGMELVHMQMDQLIQALAAFGAPAGVDGGWTEEQKEALQPVIAAYWHSPGT
jgi:Ca2+-binding RTX toxin-like protein